MNITDLEYDEHVLNFDPEENYYEPILRENHTFATYSSIDNFLDKNPVTSEDSNFVSIFCQNIRSLDRNLDSFLNLFPHDNMPDILILSETWHNLNTPVNIPGYTGYHTVRDGRAGGVSIFVKSQIPSCFIEKFSYANIHIEICTI